MEPCGKKKSGEPMGIKNRIKTYSQKNTQKNCDENNDFFQRLFF